MADAKKKPLAEVTASEVMADAKKTKTPDGVIAVVYDRFSVHVYLYRREEVDSKEGYKVNLRLVEKYKRPDGCAAGALKAVIEAMLKNPEIQKSDTFSLVRFTTQASGSLNRAPLA
jgi:hypothetical protein